ncbi:hypothetical protein D3C87_2079200 [compost metagenome]
MNMGFELEDLEIGLGRAEVNIHCCGQRTHRVVRCDGDVMCLGDCRDAPHFTDTAHNANVGLNDVGSTCGQKRQELET